MIFKRRKENNDILAHLPKDLEARRKFRLTLWTNQLVLERNEILKKTVPSLFRSWKQAGWW